MANSEGRFALDFADPGQVPESLLSVPGMVNDLTEYTLSQAHRPDRTLAFCGALAAVAHLSGNAVSDKYGTYTNLNLICLGETGIGKDVPRCTNSRLAEAAEFFVEACEMCEKMCRKATEKELPLARALMVRMSEKIAKLALIGALSQNPSQPVITGDCVKWAVSFVAFVTKQMLYKLQFHVSEGRFDAMKKRVLGLLAKHGGSMSLSALLQRLPYDSELVRKITRTLRLSDMLNEEVVTRGKTVYTLKSIA